VILSHAPSCSCKKRKRNINSDLAVLPSHDMNQLHLLTLKRSLELNPSLRFLGQLLTEELNTIYPMLLPSSLIKWSGRVELYPNLFVTGMMNDDMQSRLQQIYITLIPERYLPLSQWHHAENDLPMMLLYGIINHWRAWSLSFVKLIIHWLAQECFVSLQLLWLCEGSDNKLKMW